MILNDLMKAGALLAIKLDDEDEIESTFDVTGTIAFEDTPYGKGMVFDGSTYLRITGGLPPNSPLSIVMLAKVPDNDAAYVLIDGRTVTQTISPSVAINTSGDLSTTALSSYVNGVAQTSVPTGEYCWLGFTRPLGLGNGFLSMQAVVGAYYNLASFRLKGTIVAIIVFPFQLTTADMRAVQNGLTGYQNSLVHHWRMDSTAPRDLVGEAHHGTPTGTPTVVEWGTGEALVSDSSNYPKLASAISLAGDFTISFIGKLREPTSEYSVIGSDGTYKNRVLIRQGTLYFVANHAATVTFSVSPPIEGSFTLVRSGSTLTIYINGKIEGTGTSTDAAGPLSLSMLMFSIVDIYTPRIADYRIFNRALTPLEVRHLHATVSQEYGVSV